MKAVENFIALAQSQVGYTESGENITKYASDFDSTYWQWYNTKKQGAQWCQIFIAWLTVNIIGKKEALSFFGIPSVKDNCSAGVPYFWNYLTAKGYKVDKSKGQAGDIIFLNSNKHVGLIEYVDGDTYHTIEGNKNNKVARGTYKKSDSYIYGICHLPWEKYDTPDPEPTPKPKTVSIELPVLDIGSEGGEVLTIQMLLNEIGFKDQNGKRLDYDRIFGPKTQYALTNYQKARGLTVTGICDYATWNRILK